MCWSPGVTLFFVVAEGVAALVLASRGLPQRRLVRFMLPLIVQEVLQLALWAEIGAEAEGVDSAGCSSRRNVALTFTEMVVVVLIPTWWCLCAQGAIDASVEHVTAATTGDQCSLQQAEDGRGADEVAPWLRAFAARAATERRWLRSTLLVSVSFAVTSLTVTAIAVSGGAWAPFCTERGVRGGHQLWCVPTRLESPAPPDRRRRVRAGLHRLLLQVAAFVALVLNLHVAQ